MVLRALCSNSAIWGSTAVLFVTGFVFRQAEHQARLDAAHAQVTAAHAQMEGDPAPGPAPDPIEPAGRGGFKLGEIAILIAAIVGTGGLIDRFMKHRSDQREKDRAHEIEIKKLTQSQEISDLRAAARQQQKTLESLPGVSAHLPPLPGTIAARERVVGLPEARESILTPDPDADVFPRPRDPDAPDPADPEGFGGRVDRDRPR
jgi:hypothetical protein